MMIRKISHSKPNERRGTKCLNNSPDLGRSSVLQNLDDSSPKGLADLQKANGPLSEEALMEHRRKIRPVQLFIPALSNPNILRLNKNALNLLGHASIANKKVVVISVSGAYRKGKSFLLNFFLEYLYILQYSQKNDLEMDWLQDESQLEGFHYRPGPKRDTVGIWIWPEPIMIDATNGERYAVILMDTQGCFEQTSNSLPASSSQPFVPSTATTTNSSSNTSTNNSNYSVLALSTLLSCVQLYNMSEFIPEEAIQALKFFTDYERLSSMEANQFGKPFQVWI